MDNHKLGVIVPYRNRGEHIIKFLNRTKLYLDRHKINHEIIIVNQDNAKQFNRGMLLNIGFKYAQKLNCDYVVFHDVDMLPYNVDYSYSDFPIHLATGFKDKESNNKLFDEYFGGVTLFPMDVFKKIDGYSNKYWDWGYEDTDLLHRCRKHNVKLETIKIKNTGSNCATLKFNGVDAYVKGKNIFNFNRDTTLFISFYPENLELDHTKDSDDFSLFSVPGYDTSISFNSFSRYNFCTFTNKNEPLYVNSPITTNYKTNISVTFDSQKKIISVYQDGLLRDDLTFKHILSYSNEDNFYLGVGNPNRHGDHRYFKGHIDSFASFNSCLDKNEILEISKNKYLGLTQNFGNYKSSGNLNTYYDAKFVKNYKLIDLSGNNNDGTIVNCEITELIVDEYKKIKIPHRRESIFECLPHEENGFSNNSWKKKATRWNQLRFHNEVCKNDNLIKNDGLSTLEFIEYGVTVDNNITHVNVGI